MQGEDGILEGDVFESKHTSMVPASVDYSFTPFDCSRLMSYPSAPVSQFDIPAKVT